MTAIFSAFPGAEEAFNSALSTLNLKDQTHLQLASGIMTGMVCMYKIFLADQAKMLGNLDQFIATQKYKIAEQRGDIQ